MVIDPSIVGYSFEITEGNHIRSDPNGWQIFIIVDKALDVQFLSAYNEEVGFVVYSDYGDLVKASPDALRNFLEDYREYVNNE